VEEYERAMWQSSEFCYTIAIRKVQYPLTSRYR